MKSRSTKSIVSTHSSTLDQAPAVAGTYAKEELNEKLVAMLKEERASWWEGGLK